MKQRIKNTLLIFCGGLSLLLGVIGIFLPLLPTTPFILLAGFCFARSSRRFHDWLLAHRHFGGILRAYQSGLGIEPKIRNRALLVMWSGMLLSMLIINRLWGVYLLVSIGMLVSIYLLRLPAYRKPQSAED